MYKEQNKRDYYCKFCLKFETFLAYRMFILFYTFLTFCETAAWIPPDQQDNYRGSFSNPNGLGRNPDPYFAPLDHSKIVFNRVGYIAYTVTDITMRVDFPVYAALNYIANQSQHLEGVIDGLKKKIGSESVSTLAFLSRDVDLMVKNFLLFPCFLFTNFKYQYVFLRNVKFK
jgi:hypothetical protein